MSVREGSQGRCSLAKDIAMVRAMIESPNVEYVVRHLGHLPFARRLPPTLRGTRKRRFPASPRSDPRSKIIVYCKSITYQGLKRSREPSSMTTACVALSITLASSRRPRTHPARPCSVRCTRSSRRGIPDQTPNSPGDHLWPSYQSISKHRLETRELPRLHASVRTSVTHVIV